MSPLSPDILGKQLEALTQWKTGLDGSIKQDFTSTCEHNPEASKVEITNLIVESIRTILGKDNACPGANCFNAVLVAQKILPYTSYTSAEEIEFWLKSPLCKKRLSSFAKMPGDIVLIKNTKPVHAFTYISDEITYTKNGQFRTMKPNFKPLRNVMCSYDVAKEYYQT